MENLESSDELIFLCLFFFFKNRLKGIHQTAVHCRANKTAVWIHRTLNSIHAPSSSLLNSFLMSSEMMDWISTCGSIRPLMWASNGFLVWARAKARSLDPLTRGWKPCSGPTLKEGRIINPQIHLPSHDHITGSRQEQKSLIHKVMLDRDGMNSVDSRS